jgi:hypothetical protein
MAANPGGDSGAEYWVDGPADVQPGSNRDNPDVAMNAEGESLHVWHAFLDQTVRNDVFLRRFDSTGVPLTDPVQVNALIANDQFQPRIAVSTDDSFLVIWLSDEFDAIENGVRIWIRGQAFAANGSPVGAERLISAVSTGHGSNIRADVAALTGGGYVVVWEQDVDGGADTGAHIRARRVGADGAPVGDSFVVNSAVNRTEINPAVSELDSGGFLVVWSFNGGNEIIGRVYDVVGIAQGNDQQLHSNAFTSAKRKPEAVRGSDGRILVLWEDEELAGDGAEIRGRMFSPTLSPLGNDFRINASSAGLQFAPRAGAYGSLGFLVLWESDLSVGDDNDPNSIQARRVTGNDAFGSAQVQLNRWTAGTQHQPATGGRGERVAVVWRSGGGNEELLDDVITGQTWSVCGIFCDGFE